MADDFTLVRLAWLEQVASDKGLSLCSGPVAILLVTKYMNRQQRRAWPSISLLAKVTGRNERNVRTGIASLVDRGHLTVEIGGGNTSNRYALNLFQASETTPATNDTPVRSDTPRGVGIDRGGVQELLGVGVAKVPEEPIESEPYEEPNEYEPTEPLGRGMPDRVSSASKQATIVPITAAFIDGDLLDPDAGYFADFWEVYPKHEAEPRARHAFIAAVKAGAHPRDIIEGAARYSEYRANDRRDPIEVHRFTTSPAKWLADRRWLDDAPSSLGAQHPMSLATVMAGITAAARSIPSSEDLL